MEGMMKKEEIVRAYADDLALLLTNLMRCQSFLELSPPAIIRPLAYSLRSTRLIGLPAAPEGGSPIVEEHRAENAA